MKLAKQIIKLRACACVFACVCVRVCRVCVRARVCGVVCVCVGGVCVCVCVCVYPFYWMKSEDAKFSYCFALCSRIIYFLLCMLTGVEHGT
jgi:hypothetical protein